MAPEEVENVSGVPRTSVPDRQTMAKNGEHHRLVHGVTSIIWPAYGPVFCILSSPWQYRNGGRRCQYLRGHDNVQGQPTWAQLHTLSCYYGLVEGSGNTGPCLGRGLRVD